MPEKTHYLEMRGISKYYALSGVQANDNVDFSLKKGEIHALVGENGAGKTTLMKILNGIERADEGEIFFNGSSVRIHSPMDAEKLRIGIVHQHFRLINEFTVAQNMVLGNEPRKGLRFDNRRAEKEAAEIIRENGFNIRPDVKVSSLSISQRQQVEIVRALFHRADLLVLDEPTSVLTQQESDKLFITLKKLIDGGKTIILITHKLSEVLKISDRITVMRAGRNITVKKTGDLGEKELSRLMIGHEPEKLSVKGDPPKGREVFRLEDISFLQSGQERPLLENVSFSVAAGEVLGITGAAGNGLRELEDILSGFRQPTSGRILHDSEDITRFSIRDLRDRGLAYVPADRLRRGASIDSTITENFLVPGKGGLFSTRGVLRQKKAVKFAEDLIKEYAIEGKPYSPVGTLSGGNIQKVVLARELHFARDVVLFSEPAWGLDVASSEFIYRKILEMKAGGAAVILISSNLEEILSITDRVIVMYRGKSALDAETRETDKNMLGASLLGLGG